MFGGFFEVRRLSCIQGNDAPSSEFLQECRGNWVKLVVTKEDIGTCNRNMLRASVPQKQRLEEGDCVLPWPLHVRRQQVSAGFPFSPVGLLWTNPPVTKCQGHRLHLLLRADVQAISWSSRRDQRARESTDLNKVVWLWRKARGGNWRCKNVS